MNLEDLQKLPKNIYVDTSQIAWFYGNDPARDSDYHTIVINGLQRIKAGFWMPKLRDIFRVKKMDYLDVFKLLLNQYFPKMPPTMYAVDYTRDPTWSELIRKKLGENKTIFYKFTIDNKLNLMSIFRNYLIAGYKVPDPDRMTRNHKIKPDKAEMLRILKQESLREQTKPLANDKIGFSDGGKHNDVLHGQALSLLAAHEYTRLHSNYGVFAGLFGFDGAVSPMYNTETLKQVKERDINAIMKRKGNYDKIHIEWN